MAEARLFYESDCNLDVLSGKTVAIVGFGSQGHAHALNLHESGVNVIVGLYKGSKSWKKVEDLGLKVMETADAVKAADIVMVLAPDEKQAAIYKKDIEPNLTEGMALAFAHGFIIDFLFFYETAFWQTLIKLFTLVQLVGTPHNYMQM